MPNYTIHLDHKKRASRFNEVHGVQTFSLSFFVRTSHVYNRKINILLRSVLMMTRAGTFTMVSRVIVVRHLGGLLCAVAPMVSLFNLSSLHPWES